MYVTIFFEVLIFDLQAKEAVSNEDDHACINLHYDDHLSNGRAVYTEQRDENDRLGRDISVTIKDSEAGAEYSNDQDETLPMLVIDHVPGVMSPPRYYELTKLGDG